MRKAGHFRYSPLVELLKVRRHLPYLVLDVAVVEGAGYLPPLTLSVVLPKGSRGHPAQGELPLVGGGAQHHAASATVLVGGHLVPWQRLLAVVAGEEGELSQALVRQVPGPSGVAASAADLVLVRGDGGHGEVAPAEVAAQAFGHVVGHQEFDRAYGGRVWNVEDV